MMTQEKLFVKLVDENDKMISSFWTKNWSEVLKFYNCLVGEDITVHLNPLDEGPFKDLEGYVKGISVQFGSNESLNVLEVYAEFV